MTFQALTINATDSQFLETRQFQARDIASRIFRVPPHLIGDTESGAPASSIEQQHISFYQNTIKPWVVKIEQQLNLKLFREDEKDSHYAEFEIAGLLRGDLQSQDTSFEKGVKNGWYSVNDVRRYKNLDAIDGGDKYLTPLNMADVNADNTQPDEPPADQPHDDSSPKPTPQPKPKKKKERSELLGKFRTVLWLTIGA